MGVALPGITRSPARSSGRVDVAVAASRLHSMSSRAAAARTRDQSKTVTWARKAAGRRKCRLLGGASPLPVFEAIEAETLLPLPQTPFVLARWSTAVVGPDIHIKVGRTLCSVPWKLIGRRVDVRSTQTMVQVFQDGELVKTHAALEQGKRTDRTDYPPETIAFQMRTPIWCRSQAPEVGDACREVIDQLLEVNALYRLQAAQGVLGLKKKYSETRLEAACARAITVGDPSYRTIKGILLAGTETDPEPEGSGDAGAAAFLHGPQRLFATAAPPGLADDDRGDQVPDGAEEDAR
jgi:hypothetical protein